MHKMDLRQESRLNGVKTNIVNLPEIASDLRVPAEYVIRYICHEVGSSKEKESIIKGKHGYDDLLKILDMFIAKYILC